MRNPPTMPKLFYLHWNREELESRVRPLEEAGHQVLGHSTAGEPPRLGDFVPDAVIISLDRLPSHGRHVAEWFWEAKKRRSIPILFAGGQPDKVTAIRAQFPNALFCASEEVPARLAELLAAGPADSGDSRAAGAS